MIPGSVAITFPAGHFKALDKHFNLSLTHCTSFFLSFGAPLPFSHAPTVMVTMIVVIIIPITVKITAIVIPCLLNKILNFSAREVLPSKVFATVSLILKIWLRCSFLFSKRTSNLAFFQFLHCQFFP